MSRKGIAPTRGVVVTETTQQPVAIITGASSGIGLGVTQSLLERGWRIMATSRTISKSKELKSSPDLVLVDGEVSKKDTAVKVVQAALKHFGRIDLLVNNAGIFIAKAFTDYTEEDYNLVMNTNVASFLLHVPAGDSADEEAKFGARGEHLGGPRGSTERRCARTFGCAVEVADAGCE
jgi:NAD(P)-dependent dehydrogenase (short-subunit alcohol dehydrogenase family)